MSTLKITKGKNIAPSTTGTMTGSVVGGGSPGAQGPAGRDGKNFEQKVYEQSEASTQWVILHEENRIPDPVVRDTAGTVFETEVRIISENEFHILLGRPMRGTVTF